MSVNRKPLGQKVTVMLFPFVISLLAVATVILFSIGTVVLHQQRLERAERRTVGGDPMVVTLGDLTTEISDIDDHALAKLQLELQANRQMAEIIG